MFVEYVNEKVKRDVMAVLRRRGYRPQEKKYLSSTPPVVAVMTGTVDEATKDEIRAIAGAKIRNDQPPAKTDDPWG